MPTTLHPLYPPLWIEAVRALRREARALADALRGLRRRQRQRATRCALGALDDRTPSDLGLDRSDIAAAHTGDADRLLTWRSSW